MIDIMSSCFGRGVYIEGSSWEICKVPGATEDRRRGILEQYIRWLETKVNGAICRFLGFGDVYFTCVYVC